MFIDKTIHIEDLPNGVITEQLQQLLNKHGAGLVVDGIMGNNTRYAFSAIKRRYGLLYPELIGKTTIKYLEENIPISYGNINSPSDGINQAGIDLIKEFEGFRSKAYLCSSGVPTLGYGSTYWEDGSPVKLGQTITKDRAEKLFTVVVNDFYDYVKSKIRVPVNSNQLAALTSFTFNVGKSAFSTSTLLRVLNQGDYVEAGRQLLRWDKGGGKTVPGLTRRRKAEKRLFES